MLTTKKDTTFTGSSMIDGKQAEGYSAVISGGNPEEINISSYQVDKALYKANREICRADRAAFEEDAYALQAELFAGKA